MMRTWTRSRTALIILALVVAGCSAPSSSPNPSEPSTMHGFTNPVYDSNFPDPMIIEAGDGSYLAFATNGNGANVQTLQSKDLVSWEAGEDALPHLPAWTSPGDVWAPEVAVHGPNRYVLYYTTHAPGADIQCIGVATSSTPRGPYVDSRPGPLVCQRKDGGSIDAHPFVTAGGDRYLYWKNDGNRIGVDTWISVQRLDESGTKLVGKPKKLFKQDQPWEGTLVEAPFVWEHGRFWLFYSANDFGSTDYAVGVARADRPEGPFTKEPDPVLTSNDVAAGPGHCALIEKDGRVWMVYHAWAPDAIGEEIPGRTMWLSEVTFDRDTVHVAPPQANYATRP